MFLVLINIIPLIFYIFFKFVKICKKNQKREKRTMNITEKTKDSFVNCENIVFVEKTYNYCVINFFFKVYFVCLFLKNVM